MSKELSPLASAMVNATKGSTVGAAPADTLETVIPASVDLVYMTTPGSGEAAVIRIPTPSDCPGKIMGFVVVQDGTGTLAINYTIGEVTNTDPLSDLFTVVSESAVLYSLGHKWIVLFEDIA